MEAVQNRTGSFFKINFRPIGPICLMVLCYFTIILFNLIVILLIDGQVSTNVSKLFSDFQYNFNTIYRYVWIDSEGNLIRSCSQLAPTNVKHFHIIIY